MLNKILLSGLLVTSSFVSLSSVKAMDNPKEEQLTLSGRKLSYGLKYSEVNAKKKTFSVRAVDGKAESQQIDKGKKFTASSTNNIFTFVDYENGQGITRFNAKTSTWELIPEAHMPGQKLFELEVKELKTATLAPAAPAQTSLKDESPSYYKLPVKHAEKISLNPNQVFELVSQNGQIIQIEGTSYRVKIEGDYNYDPDNNFLRKEGITYVHIKEVQSGYREEYDGGSMKHVPIIKEVFRISLTPETK